MMRTEEHMCVYSSETRRCIYCNESIPDGKYPPGCCKECDSRIFIECTPDYPGIWQCHECGYPNDSMKPTMTPNEFHVAMNDICHKHGTDCEAIESESEKLVVKLLTELGYGRGAYVFENKEASW